jgi:PAS domain S-box-containing protein
VRPARDSAAVLHDLLTTGTFISLYTDEEKLVDFVSAALGSIPGVVDCRFEVHQSGDVAGCADRAVAEPSGDAEVHPEADEYTVELRSGDICYGRVRLRLDEPLQFRPFRAAVHNVSSTIAVRIESIRYQSHLEELVRERTRELEMSRAFLESIFERTGDVMIVVDRDFRVVRANRTAREIVDGTLIGDTWTTYRGFAELPDGEDRSAVQGAMASGEAQESVVPWPCPENATRWFSVSAFPILGAAGRVANVIESSRDITRLKGLQDELSRAVEQKAVLLREIHHRVKNNLNLVVSVLNLQFGGIPGDAVAAALQASIDRIQSMALVHQFLYRSETQKSFDFRTFVDSLVEELSATYIVGQAITIEANVPDFEIGIDRAVPVGLMLNELITNALKYAFPDGRSGVIRIHFAATDDSMVRLTVNDDGVGLPADFGDRMRTSLGMVLIQALTDQIDGTLEVSPGGDGAGRATGGGASFGITFPRESPGE